MCLFSCINIQMVFCISYNGSIFIKSPLKKMSIFLYDMAGILGIIRLYCKEQKVKNVIEKIKIFVKDMVEFYTNSYTGNYPYIR